MPAFGHDWLMVGDPVSQVAHLDEVSMHRLNVLPWRPEPVEVRRPYQVTILLLVHGNPEVEGQARHYSAWPLRPGGCLEPISDLAHIGTAILRELHHERAAPIPVITLKVAREGLRYKVAQGNLEPAYHFVNMFREFTVHLVQGKCLTV